jgi:hypothetical protein
MELEHSIEKVTGIDCIQSLDGLCIVCGSAATIMMMGSGTSL